MHKLTPLSGALAAVMIASALSGCGGRGVEPVSGSTTRNAQTSTEAKADAGAAYSGIVAKYRIAGSAYMNVVNQPSHVPAVPANFRAAARAVSAAETTQVAEYRAYKQWPQSMKPWMDQLIAQKVIMASSHLQMSGATSWVSWNNGGARQDAAAREATRLSALIRQDLGLPAQ